MLGGGVDASGTAHFARTIAKIPARRLPEAVSRLIGLYEAERSPTRRPERSSAASPRSAPRALLADLEALSPESALPEDFVDLGEDTEVRIETLEGECSA